MCNIVTRVTGKYRYSIWVTGVILVILKHVGEVFFMGIPPKDGVKLS